MVLLFRRYFFGFFVSGKVFFSGSSEIPNFAHPCLQVCQVHPLGTESRKKRRSKDNELANVRASKPMVNHESQNLWRGQ